MTDVWPLQQKADAMDSQKTGIGAIVVALLAGLAIGFPMVVGNSTQSGSSAAPYSSVAAGELENHKLPEHTAVDLILDYFGGDPDQVPVGEIWSQDTPWTAKGSGINKPYDLTMIIATLPDPIAPALREKFDARLDSIQRAAEKAGYVLDRLDLPWPKPTAIDTGLKLGQEIDLRWKEDPEPPIELHGKSQPTYLAAKGNSDESNRYLKDPGFILFRHRIEPKLLMVLVVGERPTSGIHRFALRSALDQVAWLCKWEDEKSQKPLPDPVEDRAFDVVAAKCTQADNPNLPNLLMLAPSFSGGAPSLVSTLSAWRSGLKKQPDITMTSGTTTVVGAALASDHWIHYSTVAVTIPKSEFAAYIKSKVDPTPERLAMLVEEDTQYGQFYSSAPTGKSPNSAKSPDDSILVIQFPLYISDIRRAASARLNGVIRPPPRVSNIQLPPEENAGVDYVTPHFSPRSVASDQIVLDNLLKTIHREHVRYLGIVASDVEDRIFLVQQIRYSCPDTTVFLLSSDLFYLHSDFNFDLRGTLVLSTYPLFAMNQLWTYPFDGDTERKQFPNDNAEGVFNATLSLLGDQNDMIDYSTPFSRTPTAPVLWLSIVGKDELWPINFRSSVGSNDLSRRTGPTTRQPSGVVLLGRGAYPGSFIIVFLLSTFATAGWSFIVLARYPFRANGRCARILESLWRVQPVWMVSLLGNPSPRQGGGRRPSLQAQRRSFLLAITIGFLSLDLVVATFFLLPYRCALSPSFDGTVEWLPLYTVSGWLVLGGMIVCPLVVSFCATAVLSLTFRYDRQLRPKYESAAAASPEVPPETAAAQEQGTTRSALADGVRRLRKWVGSLSSPTINAFAFGAAGVAYCLSIILPSNRGQWHYGSAATLYLFLRSVNLGDGVSPLLPILLVGVAAIALLFSSLRRIAILTASSVPEGLLAFTSGVGSFAGVAEQEEKIRQVLRRRPNEIGGARIFFSLGVFAGVWLLAMKPNGSIDGWLFDVFMFFGAFAVFVAVSWSLLRMITLWYSVRGLLRRLYRHPGRVAYENYFKGLPARQRISLTEPTLPLTATESSLQHVREMIRIAQLVGADALAPGLANPLLGLVTDLRTAELKLSDALSADLLGNRGAAIGFRSEARTATSAIAKQIAILMESQWRLPPEAVINSATASERRVIKHGELFLVARVIDFLRDVFPHFRNLMTFATVAILLTLLALSSYPFGQRDLLLDFAWLSVLAAVGAMSYVFLTMNRDRVLSLLSGTTPGQLTWNSTLIAQLLTFGVLPLLGLLGVQFPGQFASVLSSFSKLSGRAG